MTPSAKKFLPGAGVALLTAGIEPGLQLK